MEGSYNSEMPSQYRNDAGHSSSETAVDVEFVKGPKGILKAIEAVLALVTFICAVANPYFLSHGGGGWVAFVGMTAFVFNIVWYMLYAFRIMDKLPASVPWRFVLFVYCVVYTVFFFICGIVCAVKGYIPAAGAGAEFTYEAVVALLFFTCGIVSAVAAGGAGGSAAGAASFFSFAAMIAFGVGAFVSFSGWRQTDEGPAAVRDTVSRHSGTHTSSEPYSNMPDPAQPAPHSAPSAFPNPNPAPYQTDVEKGRQNVY